MILYERLSQNFLFWNFFSSLISSSASMSFCGSPLTGVAIVFSFFG